MCERPSYKYLLPGLLYYLLTGLPAPAADHCHIASLCNQKRTTLNKTHSAH